MNKLLEIIIMEWLDKSPFYKMEETEKREIAINLAEFMIKCFDNRHLEVTITPKVKEE